MNNITLAAISYVTILGWLVAYLSVKDQTAKPPLVVFHLKQALGLAIFQIALVVCLNVAAVFAPSVAMILSIVQIVPVIFWAIGIINALGEKEKPLPIFGNFFTPKFSFIGQVAQTPGE